MVPCFWCEDHTDTDLYWCSIIEVPDGEFLVLEIFSHFDSFDVFFFCAKLQNRDVFFFNAKQDSISPFLPFFPCPLWNPPLQTQTFFIIASPGQMYIYRIAAKNDALEYFGPHSAHVTAFAASLPGITRNLGYVASTRQGWGSRVKSWPSFFGVCWVKTPVGCVCFFLWFRAVSHEGNGSRNVFLCFLLTRKKEQADFWRLNAFPCRFLPKTAAKDFNHPHVGTSCRFRWSLCLSVDDFDEFVSQNSLEGTQS